jgi:ankyrin repeat protein
LKQNFEGETPIHLAVKTKNFELLQVFDSIKHESLLIKDVNGENPLFYAVRTNKVEIYNWFYGDLSHIDFFKARGEQNYKGQTIEHIVCMNRENMEIVDAIKPRPDIKDYYGNLPLFYSIMKNDVEMVKYLFKKGKDYYSLRNYKNESIFHIAGKYNATEALKLLIDEQPFQEEVIRKDFLGDTPLHKAGKRGNISILEYYLSPTSSATDRMILDL